MQKSKHIISAFTGILFLSGAEMCSAQSATKPTSADSELAQLKAKLKVTEERNQRLARDLTKTKIRSADLFAEVKELKLRFAALQDNLLNEDKEAQLEAIKNAEVLSKKNQKIEISVISHLEILRKFLRSTVVSDAEKRLLLETSIRELDAAIGLGQKPRPQIAQGSLQNAKIVSIDSESGLLVVNAGEAQAVKRGMSFDIVRGNRKLAEAIVADVRKTFSGLLPTVKNDIKDQIRIGDIAIVRTINR